MKRLTEKDDQGNWCLKGIRWEQLHEGQVITGELWKKLYGALWKLMEYEDTGMDPEEVEELRNFEKTNSYRLLKKLNAEERKNRWISVEEQLPEFGEKILMTWERYEKISGMTYRYIHVMWLEYIEDDGTPVFETENGIPNGKVLAWMPLPSPYRPAPEQDKPSGWQEQMMGAFLGDSRL